MKRKGMKWWKWWKRWKPCQLWKENQRWKEHQLGRENLRWKVCQLWEKNQRWKEMAAVILCGMCFLCLSGCGIERDIGDVAGADTEQSDSDLNPKAPTKVILWNCYRGNQLLAFDNLVEEFNSSLGTEKGIIITSKNYEDSTAIEEAFYEDVYELEEQERPTLIAVYPETAYILDQKDELVSINDYFTETELEQYIPEFLEIGSFNDQNELMIFPITKTTDIFAANATDWEEFWEETGVALENIFTQQDLVEAAEAYYLWTDAKTPTILEDGKALYGRDSIANYIYIGSYQLGHELFSVKDGKLTVDLDRSTFKILWDNYYIPYINGYFGAYADTRTEDIENGDLLAMTVSAAEAGYLPEEIRSQDGDNYSIDFSVSDPLGFRQSVNDAIVQSGMGFSMVKSQEPQQEGAAEFLKWITESKRNLNFALLAGHSPVTFESNQGAVIAGAYEKICDNTYESNSFVKNRLEVLEALQLSGEAFADNTAYVEKPFDGSEEIRELMENSMAKKAKDDRNAVIQAIKKGAARENAVERYTTDAYFDTWFQILKRQVEEILEKPIE